MIKTWRREIKIGYNQGYIATVKANTKVDDKNEYL